ncbi:MAG: dTDP-4-dehydrorhamnose reductase [Paludibacteraceae bacterium]|nr:dTDP-4-dehydrorhamnose reductase [Paludibacteraceae bacterium]
MNILVTGSMGQLGNEMQQVAKLHDRHQFFFTDILAEDENLRLDITDGQAVQNFVMSHQISAIVNCAAYTQVDKAEEDEATALKINAEAVRNLAQAAALAEAKMVHISTDYVFDGNASTPYREDSEVCPSTAYGRTKLAGEKALLEVLPEAVILRTAWLYSTYGNNFVKTMIRLGKEREELGVVFDQVGSPTYAADLAMAVMVTLEERDWHPGIYHFTNEGVCSWFDFTREIHSLYNSQEVLRQYQAGNLDAAQQAAILCNVKPIRSEEYPVKTPRPHYSVLDKGLFKKTFDVEIPYWRDSLARCIAALE